MAEEQKKYDDEFLFKIDNKTRSLQEELELRKQENEADVNSLNPYFFKEENFPDLVSLFNRVPQYLDFRVSLFVVQHARERGYERVVDEDNKVKFKKSDFSNLSLTDLEATQQVKESVTGIKKLIKKAVGKFPKI
ncbi:MAG: hypothetical protein PHN72_03710 [Bacilli bacterium]|nr:hypothetical protein [Bacilli bacterium]